MEGTTFTFQLADLFWFCGGIITVIGCMKALNSISPIKKNTSRIDGHDNLLAKDNTRISSLEERVKNLEYSSESSLIVILKSLRAIIGSMKSNDSKQLDEASKELDDYILKK